MNALEPVIKLLTLLSIVLGILVVVVPILSGYVAWKARREFATRDELNNVGSKLNIMELEKHEAQVKIDLAHTRLDKLESRIEVELEWIRSDLDEILERKRKVRDGQPKPRPR